MAKFEFNARIVVEAKNEDSAKKKVGKVFLKADEKWFKEESHGEVKIDKPKRLD